MTLRQGMLSGLVCLGMGLSAVQASAQSTEAAQDGEFSVQRFEPAPGPRNFITVSGARVSGHLNWSAGFLGSYAYKPLVVRSCRSETDCDAPNAVNREDIAVVSDLATVDLMGTLSIIERLQIGLRLPLTFTQGDGIEAETGRPARGGFSGFGLGDPYLEGKFRFFGNVASPLTLAAALFGTAPVGNAVAEDKYIGYSSPSVGGRVIADFRAGPVSAAANLGGLWRQDTKLGSTELGPEFRYGGALGYDVSPTVTVMAEGFGSTKFSSLNGTNSLEALLAGRLIPLQSRFAITAGAGAGVLEGVGVPVFRAFLGVSYTFEPSDKDGDGIPDEDDECPNDPEDLDGYEDFDGCPDPDNDSDTIPDDRDACPNEPETVNGYLDDDGCPDDVPDKDKDGIGDAEDKCPDQGGDVIRVKGQHYGCPDRDKDGVPDHLDKCPDEPEDTDGHLDEDGCPDPDNDGDGVPDNEDQCVDEPGVKENFGCPPE